MTSKISLTTADVGCLPGAASAERAVADYIMMLRFTFKMAGCSMVMDRKQRIREGGELPAAGKRETERGDTTMMFAQSFQGVKQNIRFPVLTLFRRPGSRLSAAG